MSDNVSNKKWFKKIIDNILIPNNYNDIIKLITVSLQRGKFDKALQNMIKGALNIDKLSVKDIMIPYIQVAKIYDSMSMEEIMHNIVESHHTRIPMLNNNDNDVLGIIHTKDLLKLVTKQLKVEKNDVFSILRSAIFIPESKKLNVLLNQFKATHSHLAIVIDEYGSTSGIVTIEDILEEIVGDIEDEFDTVKTKIIKISKNIFIVNASTEIEFFNNYFNCILDKNNVQYETISGLLINKLKRLPELMEEIKIKNFTFKITAADKRTIKKIQVTNNS